MRVDMMRLNHILSLQLGMDERNIPDFMQQLADADYRRKKDIADFFEILEVVRDFKHVDLLFEATGDVCEIAYKSGRIYAVLYRWISLCAQRTIPNWASGYSVQPDTPGMAKFKRSITNFNPDRNPRAAWLEAGRFANTFDVLNVAGLNKVLNDNELMNEHVIRVAWLKEAFYS